MQEIMLDKNIVLLDSPGIILSTQQQSDGLVLRQAIKVEELIDPIKPVTSLLTKVQREDVINLYGIEEYLNITQMLGLIARKKGFLMAGGIANIDEAAKSVLRDFMNGKLSYFSPPPQSALLDEDENQDQEMEDEFWKPLCKSLIDWEVN